MESWGFPNVEKTLLKFVVDSFGLSSFLVAEGRIPDSCFTRFGSKVRSRLLAQEGGEGAPPGFLRHWLIPSSEHYVDFGECSFHSHRVVPVIIFISSGKARWFYSVGSVWKLRFEAGRLLFVSHILVHSSPLLICCLSTCNTQCPLTHTPHATAQSSPALINILYLHTESSNTQYML
jgi:hypothetical protein